MSSYLDFEALRAPQDLVLERTHPRRAIIVGSCLSEAWGVWMMQLPDPCSSSFYNLGNELPEKPEHPISEYDLQIVQIPLRLVLPDGSFARLSQSDLDGHNELFAFAISKMRSFLECAMRWNRDHGILTLAFPFIVPQRNFVGRLMPRYDLRNPVYFIEQLNEKLEAELRTYGNAYMFDLNEVVAGIGRQHVLEDDISIFNHGSFISDFNFERDQSRLEPVQKITDLYLPKVDTLFRAAWQEIVSMWRTTNGQDQIKMVVVDLDDTLWRGVAAEIDAGALPSSDGWPSALWEALLFLKRRGLLLAILSKNEEARILELWDIIFGNVLKPEDFAIHCINWDPKPENMLCVLSHVNLLPRNVLYIDDNPVERFAIKHAFPEMRVLGGNPVIWRRLLLSAAETQVFNISAEIECANRNG